MKTISIHELIPNTFYTDSVYLDEKFILLTPDTPVTEDLIKRMGEWKFTRVFTDGTAVKEKAALQDQKETENSELLSPLESDPLEREKLETARAIFEKAVDFTEKYFTAYVQSGELPLEPVGEIVKEIVQAIKDERSAILRIAGLEMAGRNYLVVHSVKTAILALTSGFFLKLPTHKIIELGIAALVHEIGMIRLPPHLYMAPRQLTPQEKRAVMTHPVLGFNVLKGMSFPMAISSAVLEHHERMDGSGYPRAIAGEKISPYARVLAVCCSYDALISKRPYREAKDSHEGILDLLRDRGIHYDEQAIRALVYSLSVFPLGSYVLLSSGARAIVVEANIQSPRFPMVKAIADQNGYLYKEPQMIQTREGECTIVRILTSDEIKKLQE